MKLSKLYSNLPDKFSPIIFNKGLNFIYGEIRHPENKTKDTQSWKNHPCSPFGFYVFSQKT